MGQCINRRLAAATLPALLLAACTAASDETPAGNHPVPLPVIALSAAASSLPEMQSLAVAVPAGSGSVRYSTERTLSTGQESVLLAYMDLYYRSLAELQAGDPTDLFAPQAQVQAVTRQGVWETIVAVRAEQPTDLSLSSFSYTLTCTGITQEDGVLSVSASENSTQAFRVSPGAKSRSYDIRHQFSMINTGDGWKLLSHRQMDMTNLLAAGRGMMRPGASSGESADEAAVRTQLRTRRRELLEQHRESLSARASQAKRYRTGASAGDYSRDHDYNRDAAVDYALQWVGSRNTAGWPSYDRNGGNCQNYTSQCLFAGGIPMDHTGGSQWKWYGSSPSTAPAASGRSASWSSVSAFYIYAKSNTGYGLVSEPDANFWSGEPGDLIQLGYDDNWRHVVIITEVVRDGDGNAVDYLIASNTADLCDYPVSAYLYPKQRLIKIYGWNDGSL